MLSKYVIVFVDRKFGYFVTVYEIIRVKLGVWDDYGVFIYIMFNYIKYVLLNGDLGIICMLDNFVYFIKVFGNVIFCLDRDGRNR